MKIYSIIYQHVLIETKWYLGRLRFLILMSNSTFLDVANYCQFLLLNTYVKNGIFETCFRQSAHGKMTAWDPCNIMCLSTSGPCNWICHQHLDFHPPPPPLRFLCLINAFYRRSVSCVYIIYPLCPIYQIDCLFVSFYFVLFHPTKFGALLCSILF